MTELPDDASDRPAVDHADPSVVRWFSSDPSWSGMLSTDEVYRLYLRVTAGTPVSRVRFVADLAYLGVEEVIDDETPMLFRA